MNRAEAGEELVIGFFGGSITQGSLASTEENTYSWQIFQWWKNTFPKATFSYVNGGIGGTTSHYGTARVYQDLLMYQPDFVVVDFSVNDEPDVFFQETFEGVLRNLLQGEKDTAVLILNNVYYDTGKNAQMYHNQLADWYQLPWISIKDTLYEEMRAGKYTREELTPDGLHPNDFGHRLVAGQLIYYLEQVWKQRKEPEENWYLPEPMTQNAYQFMKRLNISNCQPVCHGFRADPEEKKGHLDGYKNGWVGKKAGNQIQFEIMASCIAVQYRKTIAKPARKAKLILDGDRQNEILLDGNFQETWGDCQYLLPVLHHGEMKWHRLEIEILEDGLAEATPFYLMSVICDRK